MKTKQIILTLSLVFALSLPAFAQTATTRTTLSSALGAGAGAQTVIVASATGITASTASAQRFILVDRELMKVTAVSSTTLTVARAQNSTISTPHASGATVIFGQGGVWTPGATATSANAAGVFIAQRPFGACTRSSQQYLPIYNVGEGSAYNCIGGKWVQQTLPDALIGDARTCNVGPAVAALGGVSTTGAAGTIYVSSIFVPYTRWVTGVSVLNGGTVGTSLTLVDLYDNSGSLLANSNTAGISGGTATSMWDIAFASAIMVTGPSRYFVGVQNTGATATFTLLGANNSFGDVQTKLTAGTFGTLPSLVIPTAFTSVAGPVACLY